MLRAPPVEAFEAVLLLLGVGIAGLAEPMHEQIIVLLEDQELA